ncbi:hypothetical protein D083_2240 [Dickeya solani RNS 08.23.3.1.A]|nr:hypothetical protein D083_2240 [Dickeya solani RNS 08.23.3.1.A]
MATAARLCACCSSYHFFYRFIVVIKVCLRGSFHHVRVQEG